ncbi:tRNA (adenosine(37)-N6)-threonylcarbamoyltransferase complex ATPase subunit type 1 TsaE [Patescibacteria group bacterium]|nr:tRNA (adenosine(37)-N6)-threonylcarbamoyltransferase complex ATPase subunit type 1 TsaE [Patescibacteria group bacterium]
MEKVLLKRLGDFVHRLLAGPNFAKDLQGNKATIIALLGDLGAGKTTFVQALAKELGIADTIQSPTYVLMKSYHIPHHPRFARLIHIDAYRLEGAKEFAALRPERFLEDPHNLVCIEWPERVGGALPVPDMTLQFSSENAGEKERYIDIRTS